MDNYKIYIHYFPNGKMYVGITRQELNQRWQNGQGYKKQPLYSEILKYGWDNIGHYLIKDHLKKIEAQILEKELIERFNSINNGYNISTGGGCGSECWCEFEYEGIIYTAKELAEMSSYDITYHDVTTRINSHGWTVERAINTPKMEKDIEFTYCGKQYTIWELYEIRKNKSLTYKQIQNRLLKHKWDVERAITQPTNIKKQPKGIGTCVFEYKGKKYNSYELCQISPLEDLKPQDITDRVNRRGWDIERAITQPKRKR